MKRILFLAAFIAVMMLSANAQAQDNNPFPPERPVTKDQVLPAEFFYRQGVYFGVQGNYDEGRGEWHNGEVFEHNIKGGMGGLFMGRYYQTPYKILYGLEMDGNLGTVNAKTSCPNDDYSCETDVGWTIGLRGRLGLVIGPFLPYVAAGAEVAGISARVKHIPSGDEYKSYSDGPLGFTAAAGMDLAFTKNYFIRAEYSYHYFFPITMTIDDVDKRVHIEYSQFKVGLGFIF